MGGNLIVIDEAAIARQSARPRQRSRGGRYRHAWRISFRAGFFGAFTHTVESLGQVQQVFYNFCAPCFLR
jgi:hypothetical protein